PKVRHQASHSVALCAAALSRRSARAIEQCRGSVRSRERVAGVAVDEDLGDGSVEEGHELTGEHGRLVKFLSGKNSFQPRLEAFLVTRSDHEGGMARQVGELGCCAQEAAPSPARIGGFLAELLEDPSYLAHGRLSALRNCALIAAQGR